MKKFFAIILLCLILTSCSQSKNNPQPAPTSNAAIAADSEVEKQSQASPSKENQNLQTPASPQQSEEKDWFSGAIGSAKIHAKFDISGSKVSGVYYYDKYKTNINLTGSIDDNFGINLNDYQIITLNEESGKKAEITGIFKTKDYIEGYWKSDNIILPMYLIREGSNITPPKQPGKDAMKFEGHWTGKNRGYFAGSEADIKVLFNDLIYYDLNAFNGTNSGGLSSFGIVSNNTAKTVFKDKAYYEEKENVLFEFKVENDMLKLNSNMYDYMCGMGVSFDSSFVKGKIDVSMPTAMEVGIVETKEQDELFEKLVGDRYYDFINYTSFVNYSDTTLDGQKVKAGNSYLRGYAGACFYIISSEHLYAAILDVDAIYYYTNDEKYAKTPPKPLADWAKEKDLNIIYNYKKL